MMEKCGENSILKNLITSCHSLCGSSISGVRYAFIDFGSDGPGIKPTRIKFSW